MAVGMSASSRITRAWLDARDLDELLARARETPGEFEVLGLVNEALAKATEVTRSLEDARFWLKEDQRREDAAPA